MPGVLTTAACAPRRTAHGGPRTRSGRTPTLVLPPTFPVARRSRHEPAPSGRTDAPPPASATAPGTTTRLRAQAVAAGVVSFAVYALTAARTVTFDEARHICEMVGRHVMQAHPKEVTMEWAVVKRTGKIFIDYNMNVRGKTLNVAYSPRGVPGAPISMPLTWEELEAAEPMHFTLRNVLDRLEKAGDRWHDVLSAKQSLAKAFTSKGRK